MRSSASVAITGLGAICAAGNDVATTWQAALAGRSGLRPSGTTWTGAVGGSLEARLPAGAATGDRLLDLALIAAREAFGGARPAVRPERIAVVVGTTTGSTVADDLLWEDELAFPVEAGGLRAASHLRRAAVAIGEHLGLRGPRLTCSTACSSGTTALAVGRELLLSGDADVVLVGGVDVLSERGEAGFAALRLLADGPCEPFGLREGISLGEGAAFLVLEATDPGERALAWLSGTSLSADAFHPTAPDPTGGGTRRAIAAALADAAVGPEEVGWYVAHATGTAASDVAEWRGAGRVLPASVPVSAPKAMTGHPFAAGGSLQAVLAVMALREGRVPPTAGLGTARDGAPDDLVREARPVPLAAVVTHGAAFGGHNATAAITSRPSAPVRDRREVFVRGVGLVAEGADPDPWTVLAAGERVVHLEDGHPVGRCVPRVERELRGIDPRDADHGVALLGAAVGRALARSGPVRGDLAGLFAGVSWRPVDSGHAFLLSHRAGAVSPTAFGRLVVSAAPGQVARVVGLRGPSATLAVGTGAGLFAVGLAARWLAARRDADAIVATGHDELQVGRLVLDPEQDAALRTEGSAFHGAGAAAAVLALDGPVRVAGIRTAGTLAEAVTGMMDVDAIFGSAGGPVGRALEDEALAGARRERRCSPADVFGYGEAWTSAAALAWAAHALEHGELRSALVVAADRRTGAVAVRLEVA
ncbi:MAG: hypothetical protein H6738_18500 [Alphaproteobacteria bacterium]|nr:hypothetical protein [Alphaproteobacteria bacterium]